MTESSVRKRPVWVWLISVPYIFLNAWFLLSAFLFLSGIVSVPPDLPPELAASINDKLTGNAPFFLITHSCLCLAAAIALVRLRKVAFYLFAVLLGISLFNIEIDGLSGTTFDWIILIAICIYTWRLKQKGVLR
ncbi:hypothetical protein [cf. Phormidesmis sp. LEGE 11477]|uniref:hypothetical protein n=1 Tax=cf. Phormidesmis sp. LEGE 11477 TaxID=1828680 RepID=UPI00187ECC94|nr:hypothetical protein [cf. Phormidesmis sp. LEGE 11477]MBE9060759.1 hypothetical protein [cf. Phormidesmis sp. LEGE 11477]